MQICTHLDTCCTHARVETPSCRRRVLRTRGPAKLTRPWLLYAPAPEPTGQWTALGGPLTGKCVANTKGCNDIGNKCCIHTTSDKAERYCKGGGQRVYCVFTDNTCRLCPPVASTVLDFFV